MMETITSTPTSVLRLGDPAGVDTISVRVGEPRDPSLGRSKAEERRVCRQVTLELERERGLSIRPSALVEYYDAFGVFLRSLGLGDRLRVRGLDLLPNREIFERSNDPLIILQPGDLGLVGHGKVSLRSRVD